MLVSFMSMVKSFDNKFVNTRLCYNRIFSTQNQFIYLMGMISIKTNSSMAFEV